MKWVIAFLFFFCGAANADILVAGDSVSLGWMPYLQERMEGVHHVGRCDRLSDYTASGQNMGNSARLAACLPQILMQHPSGMIVVFNAGLHDVHVAGCKKGETHRQVELSDYLSNLQSVIDSIRAAGDIPVFVTTTPVQSNNGSCHYNSDIIVYNSAAVQMMQSQGIQVDDLYSDIYPIQGYLHGNNGIHFTHRGYKLISRFIEKSL